MKSNNRGRKGLAAVLAAIICLLAAGAACAEETEEATWSIEVLDAIVTDNLVTTQRALEYGGDISEEEYAAVPTEGNVYALVKLSIEKESVGKGKFVWEQLSIRDEAGTAYSRHSDDVFLESHNFKRIKSSDLTFGKNEGFICFEIPEEAARGKLTLVYEATDPYEIPLSFR